MFSVTLNRVRDKITVKEGNEKIILSVDSDARVITTKIRRAQELLVQANKPETTEEERAAAAIEFSRAIFGADQTDELYKFYNWDYSCVITICGIYFEKRLRKKIAAAQKKIK